MPSLRNWKSQYIVKEGKALNFGSHKEKLGVNDSQTSTNGSLLNTVYNKHHVALLEFIVNVQ